MHVCTQWKPGPVAIIPSSFSKVSSTLGKSQFPFLLLIFCSDEIPEKRAGTIRAREQGKTEMFILPGSSPDFFSIQFTGSDQFTAGRLKHRTPCSPMPSKWMQIEITLWSSLTPVSLPQRSQKKDPDTEWTFAGPLVPGPRQQEWHKRHFCCCSTCQISNK